MENSPPDCFVAFLKIILEIQAHADQWKSKLFYIEPNQIIELLTGKKEESQNTEKAPQNILLTQVIEWINSRRKQNQQTLTQQGQKVLSKYFGFDENKKCQRQQFFRKLHPTNNKIILSIERSNLTAQECLNGFLNSILSGFDRLKPFRHRCLSQLTSIKLYFCQHLSMPLQHSLTKELLKEFMYEANLYGRINFMYIKQYLFGDKVEEIQWERLFGGVKKVQKLPEIVLEVSEENIMSEQAIKEDLSRYRVEPDVWKQQQNESDVQKQKQEQNGLESRIIKQHMNNLTLQIYSSINQSKQQSQSLILQTVSQIKTPFESIAKIQLLTPQQKSSDYSKVLSEIDHIESLLSKTKQRYQKNREQLQNQTKMIRSSSLKRKEDFGKLTTNSNKTNDKYEGLKIIERRQQVGVKNSEFNCLKAEESVNGKGSDQKAKSQLSKTKHSYVITDIHNIQSQSSKPSTLTVNPNQLMTQSHVKPYITREAMRKEISSILRPQKQEPNQPQQFKVPQRRQAGKIKRRSVSKEVKEPEKPQTRANELKYSNFSLAQEKKSNYSQYEAVLKEIKKQENQYRRLVEERQKAIYERETRQKLTLTNSNQYKRYTPISQSFARTQPLQTPKYQVSHHESHFDVQNFSQIVPSSNLSRSRISSKKRQEIVHRATSEARLRIQEIQNRALKRLAKIDTQICQKPSLQKFNSQISQSNPAIKQTKKQNIPTVAVKKHQNSQKKPNLLINDLLNQRPVLRLTYTASKTNKF